MLTVSEMILDAMQRRGVTQQRLAKEARVTAPWINMILRKKRTPGAKALLRIADTLSIDRAEIVRRAHNERVFDEWRSYLPVDESGENHKLSADLCLSGIFHADRDAVEDFDSESNTKERAAGGIALPDGATALLVSGSELAPWVLDGQYLVLAPAVHYDEIKSGSAVHITFDPLDGTAQQTVLRRIYIHDDEKGVTSYVLTPINTALGVQNQNRAAIVLRARQMRAVSPVIGVIF